MEMQPPMRIFCKNLPMKLSAAVRGDKVIFVPDNPRDKSQHWIQDYSVGNLTDDEGSRAFALVNVTTGHAMVNIGGKGMVQLVPYSNDVAVELCKLWTMGKTRPDGFAHVRVLQDIEYSLNAINGNPKEGTQLGTYQAEETDNALWKIVPINED